MKGRPTHGQRVGTSTPHRSTDPGFQPPVETAGNTDGKSCEDRPCRISYIQNRKTRALAPSHHDTFYMSSPLTGGLGEFVRDTMSLQASQRGAGGKWVWQSRVKTWSVSLTSVSPSAAPVAPSHMKRVVGGMAGHPCVGCQPCGSPRSSAEAQAGGGVHKVRPCLLLTTATPNSHPSQRVWKAFLREKPLDFKFLLRIV